MNLRKTYPPNKEVLKDLSLSFFPGAKIGIIGNNGSGKSTLLKIIAGIEKDFSGEVHFAPQTKVGYLPQEPQLDPTKNVKENIEEAVLHIKALLTRFEQVNEKFSESLDADQMDKLLEEQARLQDQIDAANAWDLDQTLEYAMDALRCPKGDANVSTLSGGERRRVALCKILLQKPDILLLDEPTNHLDAESIAWLENHLKQYSGTVILITHDRYFLDNVVEWILELDRGEGIPWHSNYSHWLEEKQKRLEREEKTDKQRQKTLERELEWVKSSQKARQAKGKARLNAYEAMIKEAERVRDTPLALTIATGPRLGQEVVVATQVGKIIDDRILFEKLDFRLPQNGIVGVIGPNGAGKTTLFRMIVAKETPSLGSLKVGDTVKISYVDQNRDDLVGEHNVWQEISGGEEQLSLGQRTVSSRAYCGFFGFRGADQQKPVGVLSGGERNRVHLAKLLKNGGNLLLLDEPTNDLDIDTLRALENALAEFAGCAVIISHDRWFLDRIATHILAFEGNSQVVFFEGNYQDYEVDRKRRLGAEAATPKRIRYKSLTRN